MAIELTQKDLEALIIGGCFFGSGGGGTLESAKSLISNFKDHHYYPNQTVKMVSVEEAKHGDSVMVAYLGSPEAINGTKFPEGPILAVKQIQAHLEKQGRKLGYVVPPESGALGFGVACLVAAKLGLAVVDGDGAGRAVPSLPQLTYAAAEVNPRPTILVSQKGLSVELDVKPRGEHTEAGASHQQDVSAIIDQMLRPIVAEQDFGEFGGLAMWIMSPEKLKSAMPIRGTISRALSFGKLITQQEITTTHQLLETLKKDFHLKPINLFAEASFSGAEVDTTGGFDLGKIKLKNKHGTCTVLYQNESLLVWQDSLSHPIAMAPDSIAYFVEGKEQNIYSNGDLVLADGTLDPKLKGKTVSLIGIPADPELRKPDGLILTSFMSLLQTMGYLGNYVPIEKLQHTHQ